MSQACPARWSNPEPILPRIDPQCKMADTPFLRRSARTQLLCFCRWAPGTDQTSWPPAASMPRAPPRVADGGDLTESSGDAKIGQPNLRRRDS